MIAKKPAFVIVHAVKGMLPKTRLGAVIIKKLKVYAGAEHPHKAQKPEVFDLVYPSNK
jgi:large subunit ribosomal protein L13